MIENQFNFLKTKKSLLYILIWLVILAVLAPFLSIYDPYILENINVQDKLLPPLSSTSTHFYFLGTDNYGRDLWSCILYGLRVSLYVALLSAFTAFCIGTVIGLLSGYYGHIVDNICMRVVDVMLSMPSILVALFFMALFGKGVDKLFFALILVQWAYFARAARGLCILEKNKTYVEAMKSLNFSHKRIVFYHIFLNCLPSLVIVGVSQIGQAIALEATLSFFGLGLPISQPSLGLLISNGFEVMMVGKYWVSLFPGIILFLLVFSLNFWVEKYKSRYLASH